MKPLFGWALAAVLVAAGWQSHGAKGVALAVSLIVFWLLLQFNRTVRVMKMASDSPVGFIDNAVMLNARLKDGMALVQVIAMTKSLGHKVSDAPESWRWQDGGGSAVTLVFDKARLQHWTLERPAPAAPQEAASAP